MEGIRAFLVALLVLLGAGVAPVGTNAAAGPTALATSQIVSQTAPVDRATPAPPAPPAAPAFKVVPVGQIGALVASGSKSPYFRGGSHSRASEPTSSPTPAPHLATASPNIVVYNGLNKPGLNAAGIQITPPDSTGAIGPNNYVEMVNSRIAVYDRSLNLVNSATLQTFAGQNPLVPLCDVQIEWDPSASRWLFAFLYCGNAPNNQGFFLGWSRTSDPSTLSTGGWCEFLVQTTTLLFDYPKLGHNSKFLIVGGNFYANPTTSTPSFVRAAIAWLPLPVNGDTTCGTPTITGTPANPLKNGDGISNTFTPVPVNTDSNVTDGYVLSAYDPSGSNNNNTTLSTQSKLAVWHLDSAGVLHPDADIAVNPYTVPFSAPQSGGGTTDVIDTLDGRLTQAVGDPATGIWTQHTVNGAGNRSVVDWYELTFPGSNPVQHGVISSPTDFVFNAAISPTSNAQGAAIEYNRSSSSIFPIIAAQVRGAGTAANQMEPGEIVLATSSAADADFSCNFMGSGAPCRWGDYSAATPDPVQTNVVWGTNEFNTASTFNPPAWSDENFALVLETPHAPTGVMARAGDQSAWVGWTPSTFDPGTPTTSYKLTAYVGVSPVATLTVSAPGTAAIFKGLTNGTTYAFTVIAINVFGPSPESAPSIAVTPTRAVQQLSSPPPLPSRPPVNQNPPTSPKPR